ncbi:condensin subunit Smc [Aminomonas paucivorans DSM 12260]|uniref:Chromosome partition protein Smc n=1 Tax=Aminomonas paucivorans DSM 12260 TaxID=584708 RepID=E3CUW6_9BACT|nr:chromosome segregation protein SMC [Aminomonas paucivorans]EFQ24092.1 condensin subunit Smc [Aminomonas paucivorans DSM 12260]
MYIARLHLRGFKSFGGSHDLALGSGFVAVVGPNGSGKSNLLDALRWTLGDSHPGRLRIARQSDLLFQGSPSLPGAKEAEVTLQLREDLRVCTLRRRVLADGSTQALVDGERRTLQELEETKRQFRLEGDRFAFIGQGEVAEVIQQRPSARRLQLETLFGIDVYRKRRTDAADRLARGQEEYQRLRAFSAELAARREEIAPEVARATRARELLDRLEELRRRYYWVRRRHLEETLEERAAALELLGGLRESRSFWRRAWSLKAAYLEGEWNQATASREEETRQRETLRRFFEEQGRRAYSLGTSLAEGARGEEELRGEERSLEQQDRRQAAESEAHREVCSSLEGEWQEVLAQREELKTRHEEIRSRARADREIREELLRRRGALEAEKASAGAYLSTLGQRWLEGRKDLERLGHLLEEVGAERDRAAQGREGALARVETASSRHAEAYARCQESAAEIQRLRRETASLRSKTEEWSEVLELQVLPRPVQHVVSAARLGKLDASPVVVLDAFRCPPECAEAVEAFLGGRQFWMLVKTLEESGRCIDLLKGHQAGRGTFLPLERTRPRHPDRAGAASASGAVGFALDLVEIQDQWRPALEHLMGDLLVVRTYRDGQSVARSAFRGPVATLEGDVFQPTGAVSGGKNASRHRALELKAQIEEGQARVGEMESRIASLEAALLDQEETEREAASGREKALGALKEAEAILEEASRRLGALEEERSRSLQLGEDLRRLLKEQGRKRLETLREARDLEERLPSGEGAEEESALEAEWERCRSRVELLEERLKGARFLLERMEEERRRLVGRREQIRGLLEERKVRRGEALEELRHLGQRWLEAHRRREDLARQGEEGAERLRSLQVRLEVARRRQKGAEGASVALEARLGEAMQERSALDRELTELVATWEDQYPYPGVEPGTEEDPAAPDPEELRRKVRELDRAVKDLGPVDLGALSEDRSLQDRLAFLGEQLDDVRGSMGELEKLIADADRQAQTVFSKALGEIDRRFDHLFQRLFGGGEAHLVLLEAANPWEAGVEVVARPPGKRPQGISQLSGGEQSLSAIALLFASMEVAGCPLAVLDEVDAALDEVNLRRFADLAREYAQSRQILAMTHRRVTMERADLLYGVTLSEPGLSQVVGVRLEDWA